ncbi:malate thiokinase large subunit [Fulvimarina manganoxydans]|uniref:Succinate--CoA ligase [ADP-forming] subunit beta n=1 Tax=Fulvimarina manganoxydans TaxID=937218 RepID=A0A1W2DK34_9HYPH|nr:malate--CoA ligase subunit beta [Fulvimarina manganoxydans]SMC97442.1 malate thiokinase large subunit [Fulvimarina manganoxydans]
MDIHEFQAKELLATKGVKLPRGGIAYSPEQARYRASEIGGEAWVVKAQIHSGARGKAGGIILCRSEEDVEAAADNLIGRRLVTHQTGPKGNLVNRLYIEETVQIDRELYLGIVLDRKAERIKIIASPSGGMEIEEIAAKEPDSLIEITVDPGGGMQRFQARELAFGLGLDGSMVTKATDTLLACYRVFRDFDATMLEINPLVVSKGELMALDCKMSFDENALFRRPDISEMRDKSQEDPRETFASDRGLSYVGLEGEIGCIINGAGLAMATLDMIKLSGGEPANFLDIGGGASPERVAKSFRAVLQDKNVKVILVNIFAGINRCDWVAEGVVKAREEVGLDLPLIVRLSGTKVEEGKKILAEKAPDVVVADTLQEAAERAVAEWKKLGQSAAA